MVRLYRKKTGTVSIIRFGKELENRPCGRSPTPAPLFPNLQKMREAHRATEFRRFAAVWKLPEYPAQLPLRMGGTGQDLRAIPNGSRRWLWVTIARPCIGPTRKKLRYWLPTLEDFEKKMTAFPTEGVIVPMSAALG